MKTYKEFQEDTTKFRTPKMYDDIPMTVDDAITGRIRTLDTINNCLLYTSPSPRDLSTSRMPSSA